MRSVIDRLSVGDQRVLDAFVSARAFWTKFFEARKKLTTDELSKLLGNSQAELEHELDLDRALAKEIMALTCFAALYDDASGFGNNRELAKRMLEAFKKSMVSIEVKGLFLERAVAIYDLNE